MKKRSMDVCKHDGFFIWKQLLLDSQSLFFRLKHPRFLRLFTVWRCFPDYLSVPIWIDSSLLKFSLNRVFKHSNRMWASSRLSPCERRCSPNILMTGPSACPCPSYRIPIGETRLIQVDNRSIWAASVLPQQWAHRASWSSPARGPGTKDCRDPVRFRGQALSHLYCPFPGI